MHKLCLCGLFRPQLEDLHPSVSAKSYGLDLGIFREEPDLSLCDQVHFLCNVYIRCNNTGSMAGLTKDTFGSKAMNAFPAIAFFIILGIAVLFMLRV